jgi:hypothetical protein
MFCALACGECEWRLAAGRVYGRECGATIKRTCGCDVTIRVCVRVTSDVRIVSAAPVR